MITVFTPVYNRAYTITKLYESLCRQTCKDFEWIVVDDGSTDNIDVLIENFINEEKINIRYFKQPNGGKHRAINRGVKEAKGEMFFIVDSDDCLTNDAISWIVKESEDIIDNPLYAGISGIRITLQGNNISHGFKSDKIDVTVPELRFKYHIKGDLAEVYKTSVMRIFPFPEIENEKFCPEALVWYRIASRGLKLRVVNQPIYICEYLNDGLTAKIVMIRHKAPIASMIHYSERAKYQLPLNIKIKSVINFWRFSKFSKLSDDRIKFNFFIWFCSIFCFPAGLVLKFNDYKIEKNKKLKRIK